MFNIHRVINKVAYQAALRKGFQNESRVLEAFTHAHFPTPVWFRGITKATEELDHKGVDYVVESDIGKLYVQNKSSDKMANKFRSKQEKRRYNQFIAVVSLQGAETDEQICERYFIALKKLRNKLLALRSPEQRIAS